MNTSRAGEKGVVFDEDFGFRARWEAEWGVVLAEWRRFDRREVQLWPQPEAYLGAWGVFALYAAGQKIEQNCYLFPETTRLVESVPGFYTAGFSCLGPRSSLPAHCGEGDDLLRCHLAIEIPPRSGIEIQGQTHGWVEGKTFCFDDTRLHRAWNDSDRPKCLLVVDFHKPAHLMPIDPAHSAQRFRDASYYARMFPDWREKPPA
jgi:ornithine lipid ester-linked acyl 2-hydroxylase